VHDASVTKAGALRPYERLGYRAYGVLLRKDEPPGR
jgi:hypothetical protein